METIDYLLISSMNIFQTNQPHLLGASLFSPDDIYLKLKKLKAALPKDVDGVLYVNGPVKQGSLMNVHSHFDRPKLYFVKLDVQACFDTIDQIKLLQILRQIISEVHPSCFLYFSLIEHLLSRILF